MLIKSSTGIYFQDKSFKRQQKSVHYTTLHSLNYHTCFEHNHIYIFILCCCYKCIYPKFKPGK